MAKKKYKPTKEISKKENAEVEAEKSDEVLEEVDAKKVKADKKNNDAKADKKKLKAKKNKNDKPKRHYGKEVVSELKKVNWPTFKNACKQTGAVLVVVGVFMLAVLGIDSLVAWILRLIAKI